MRLQQFLDRALQPNEHGASLAQQRKILRLRGGSSAERNDAGFLLLGGFADDAHELFVLDSAEFRFAKLRKYFGDGLLRRFDDALIEVHVLPADLAAQQARDSGLAAAHKADQADERARRGVQWSSADLVSQRVAINQFSKSKSITFEDVDCTIEGSHLNLGAAFIESAEQSVAPLRQ